MKPDTPRVSAEQRSQALGIYGAQRAALQHRPRSLLALGDDPKIQDRNGVSL